MQRVLPERRTETQPAYLHYAGHIDAVSVTVPGVPDCQEDMREVAQLFVYSQENAIPRTLLERIRPRRDGRG